MPWLVESFLLQPTLWFAGAVFCLGAGFGMLLRGWVRRLGVARQLGQVYAPGLPWVGILIVLLCSLLCVFAGIWMWHSRLVSISGASLSGYLMELFSFSAAGYAIAFWLLLGIVWGGGTLVLRLLLTAGWVGVILTALIHFGPVLSSQAGVVQSQITEQGAVRYRLFPARLPSPAVQDSAGEADPGEHKDDSGTAHLNWVRFTVSGAEYNPWLTGFGVPGFTLDTFRIEPAIMQFSQGRYRLLPSPEAAPVSVVDVVPRAEGVLSFLIALGVAEPFAVQTEYEYAPLSQSRQLVIYRGKITVLSGNIGRY